MKLAVYCITLNEKSFVDRMIESVLEADYIVITDTGSTDGTIDAISQWSERYPGKIFLHHMHVKPWRFDVARNISLSNVPADADVCLCLDLDEIMLPGWRTAIEEAWTVGTTSRGDYTYVWSFKNGVPDVVFTTDKIHSRQGYLWTHPVHETLRPYFHHEVRVSTTAEMHHLPDPTKSRGQYLPLLELSVFENPYDDRNAFYLGREYFFYGLYQKAIDQLAAYRALPTALWNAERGASWRFSGRCHTGLGELDSALQCFTQATTECPEMRESWVDLAECFYHMKSWEACMAACQRALMITEIPMVYIMERAAYGYKAHDFMSIAAWNLKKYDLALKHAKLALAFDPTDERLQKNLEQVRNSMMPVPSLNLTGSSIQLSW